MPSLGGLHRIECLPSEFMLAPQNCFMTSWAASERPIKGGSERPYFLPSERGTGYCAEICT